MLRLDFTKILNSDHPACIRLLASEVLSRGYVTPWQFFKNLSQADLDLLTGIVERDYRFQELAIAEGKEEEYATQANSDGLNTMLLSAMLVSAEGLDIEFKDEQEEFNFYAHAYGLTRAFISLESLKRKGLVEVNYRAFTYDPSSNEVIAKPKI
jgi:hypothetical protein